MRTRVIWTLSLLLAAVWLLRPAPGYSDPRLAGSARGEKGGWITVRLSGEPRQLGFQHGWLLAPEIEDALAVTKLNLTHDSTRDWNWFRAEAQKTLWPKVEPEYREEMQGIAEGLIARGIKADVWDIVALNASLEFGYYTAMLDQSPVSKAPDRCSALVATGGMTKDGKVVIAHNNWSGYLEGARWNIIFDLRPSRGARILMDGFPGFIHSGDDFGVTSAGLAITETTITGFKGFDPQGTPEFVRARQAMQYARSIDDFERLMRAGNNGGYANAWLVADVNTNEIARLELGLKNVTLERTRDGYFSGANFPVNPKLAAEETDFAVNDPGVSANARRTRWEELMQEWRGRIDAEAGKKFMTDHHDAFEKKSASPNERTLCGHIDLSPRGLKPWFNEFGPAGTVQNKVASAAMIRAMTLEAAAGHACGIEFKAAAHLKKHPRYDWMKPLLRDLPAGRWTRFEAAR